MGMTQQAFDAAVNEGRWADLMKESFYRDGSGNIFQRVALATADSALGNANRGVQPDASVSGKAKLTCVGSDSAIDLELVPKGSTSKVLARGINDTLMNFQVNLAAEGTDRNFKIATLPADGANHTKLFIQLFGSGTSGTILGLTEILVSWSTFEKFLNRAFGSANWNPCRIRCYEEADATLSVYLTCIAGTSGSWSVIMARTADAPGAAQIYNTPVDVGASPTGTLQFDSNTALASGATVVGELKVGNGTNLKKLLSATASLDFGSINAAASADLTITVTGAAVGDSVSVGLAAAPTAGIVFQGFVSAADTVTIRATNITASPVDPLAQTIRATVSNF